MVLFILAWKKQLQEEKGEAVCDPDNAALSSHLGQSERFSEGEKSSHSSAGFGCRGEQLFSLSEEDRQRQSAEEPNRCGFGSKPPNCSKSLLPLQL